MAAVLGVSIKQAYREFESPRHVDYIMKRRNDLANLANHPDASPRMVKLLGNTCDFEQKVNVNPDGSYMRNNFV